MRSARNFPIQIGAKVGLRLLSLCQKMPPHFTHAIKSGLELKWDQNFWACVKSCHHSTHARESTEGPKVLKSFWNFYNFLELLQPSLEIIWRKFKCFYVPLRASSSAGFFKISTPLMVCHFMPDQKYHVDFLQQWVKITRNQRVFLVGHKMANYQGGWYSK